MGVFHFRDFNVDDSGCGMKICSDSVLLAAWFLTLHTSAKSIADIGTGSGILALLAARICPHATVDALEIDPNAANAATANFAASPYAERLNTITGDFLNWIPEQRYSLIISNPPYFTTGERSADRARSAARHQEGLSYESLLSHASGLLENGGHLGMVSPADFENEIVFRAEMAGMKLRRLLRVRTSPSKAPTRLLWDFSPTDGKTSTEELALRQADGSYSASYRGLVEKYYLKL